MSRSPVTDHDRAAQALRAVQAAAQATELHYRATEAVATAVSIVSGIADRHGLRMRPPAGLTDIGGWQGPLSWLFTAAGVAPLRRQVTDLAGHAGVVEEALPGFALAVQELMTNAIRHGGGWGRVRIHRDAVTLLCTVTDRGPGIGGNLAELGVLPPPQASSGRGLFLVRQMTDGLDLGSGPGGLTATITMKLPPVAVS